MHTDHKIVLCGEYSNNSIKYEKVNRYVRRFKVCIHMMKGRQRASTSGQGTQD
jgi:hypothetical protein